MQLEVEEIKALEPVKFNYEELKTQLATKVENYKNIIYTEDNMKAAKTDRANFNKLIKALTDEKTRIKNIILEPFTPFENQCNELIGLAKEASTHIDTQVKSYEQSIKDEKLKEIMDFFIENVGNYKDLIDFDNIFNERWLNVTYKMEQIQKDILHIITKTETDMNVIDSQFQDENIKKQVKMEYFTQIANPSVLSIAIMKGNTILENNKKLEELQQKEEKVTNIPEKVTENKENVTEVKQNETEKLLTIDFTINVTREQMETLKRFLVENRIVPRQGISNNEVEFIVSKIEDRVQWCREEGETDLRTILNYVQGIVNSISKDGAKETARKLKIEE